MNILFVTPRLLYPVNRGDKVRPFNFAKVLAKKHNLSLFSFIQTKAELQHVEPLKEFFSSVDTITLPTWKSKLNMGLNILSGEPLQVSYFKDRGFDEKISEILARRQIDVVYIFHLRMAQYFIMRNNTYRVLDLCDTVSFFMGRLLKHARWYMKPIYTYEIAKVKKYEQQLMDYFEEYWIISREDRDALESNRKFSNIQIIPNGVDIEYFKNIEEGSGRKSIIFVGYMGVESIDAVFYFYNQILPMVREEVPDVLFYIVGANPPDKIKALEKDKNIIVTGYVEDLRDYYKKASVAIAPMRFVAGMQNKILEAMSMSLPVVSTFYGNEGINAKDGESIFVEDKPEHFAQKVILLLKNNGIRRQMGNSARKFVEENYSWNKVLGRVEEIEKKIVNAVHS
ncbi:glycosyltransferase [Candidatus Brocadia pituitae]|nr:glycosyltransferase [Candidatus Brocadia pituitae]